MSRKAKATPGTLGDVAPGDWATLEDGREVRFVCRSADSPNILVREGMEYMMMPPDTQLRRDS